MYTKRERKIFQYFDGTKWRWADPAKIRRKLLMAASDLGLALKNSHAEEDLPKDASSQDKAIAAKVRAEAEEVIILATRKAFQMPENPDAAKPEDYGADDSQVFDAFNAWLEFVKKKDDSTNEKPIGLPPTAQRTRPK